MPESMPTDGFLDSERLRAWTDVPPLDRMSPNWLSAATASACEYPVIGFAVGAPGSPILKCFANERMNRYWLSRRLSLARADNSIDDGARHVHSPLFEVDIGPLQTEQLTLAQASGGGEQY